MNKFHVGDEVMVRTGKWRTKTGTILKLMPTTAKAIVEGVNIQKKHQKKSSQHPQGGIIERPAPIALSKLMLLDPKTKKPTRVHLKIDGKSKVRVAKSGETIVTAQPKKATAK